MCLADWIESPHYSLVATSRGRRYISASITASTELLQGQTLLSLDGYHVGADWVIALDYDEASQAGQGAFESSNPSG